MTNDELLAGFLDRSLNEDQLLEFESRKSAVSDFAQQADAMIRVGDARRILVIGADTLSRISDPHDRDSLIYADGAGAVILEAAENDGSEGILAHAVRSDCVGYASMLTMGPSNLPGAHPGDLFPCAGNDPRLPTRYFLYATG